MAFGEPKPEFAHEHIHDVNAFEWASWLPILLLIVGLGIFPGLLFRITDPAVTHMIDGMTQVVGN